MSGERVQDRSERSQETDVDNDGEVHRTCPALRPNRPDAGAGPVAFSPVATARLRRFRGWPAASIPPYSAGAIRTPNSRPASSSQVQAYGAKLRCT